MDDFGDLQAQLDLIGALQNRRPLRVLPPEQRPAAIGGQRAGPAAGKASRWCMLQSEFLSSSLAMQERVRPHLERMREIQRSASHSSHWQRVNQEIRLLAGDGADRPAWRPVSGGRREADAGKDAGKDAGEDAGKEERAHFEAQLRDMVESRPGWCEVQRNIRSASARGCLAPVVVEDFYIVRHAI